MNPLPKKIIRRIFCFVLPVSFLCTICIMMVSSLVSLHIVASSPSTFPYSIITVLSHSLSFVSCSLSWVGLDLHTTSKGICFLAPSSSLSGYPSLPHVLAFLGVLFDTSLLLSISSHVGLYPLSLFQSVFPPRYILLPLSHYY
jgi:hypothetical protein